MFEIFIALFGGAYYAGKIGLERAEHKAAVKKHERWKQAWDAFHDRVYNFDLQCELEDFIADPNNYEAVRAEVYDVVKDWPAEYYVQSGQWSPKDALYIMMVKRGFVPSEYIFTYHYLGERDIKRLEWGIAELRKQGIKVTAKRSDTFGDYQYYFDDPIYGEV